MDDESIPQYQSFAIADQSVAESARSAVGGKGSFVRRAREKIATCMNDTNCMPPALFMEQFSRTWPCPANLLLTVRDIIQVAASESPGPN